MSTLNTAISPNTEAAAHAAGLTLTPLAAGVDLSGNPTDRAEITLLADPEKKLQLELSAGFAASDANQTEQMRQFFAETAARLKNPRPDCYLTLLGIPLSFGKFAWPFHGSTSGADTSIVHGEIRLENGGESILHAKVSASLTRTFADVVAALEQPFAESFVYNAVRKTLDQGQLELVKSGNRQPVPVTTRYYSAKQHKFIFNDTDAAQRKEFLAGKVFWLSHILGGDAPVWTADPRDAQYLNCHVQDLHAAAAGLAAEGLIEHKGEGWAVATKTLQSRHDDFFHTLEEGLQFTRPSFNEEMRAGHTNM